MQVITLARSALCALVSGVDVFSIPALSAGLVMGFASLTLAEQSAPPPGAVLPNVLYGAAYYNEYMPADLQPGRLEKDVALMAEAGISVVRMGESTWRLWEPGDGRFEYAWMDRVVDAMGKAGIKVVLGTPNLFHACMDG